MTKSTVLNLGVAVLVGVLVWGCATTTKGPTDEELIMTGTQECLAAAKAQDIDGLIAHYSDDFYNYELGDKKGMKAFLEEAKSMGYLDGLEIDLEKAQTVIDGDTATVSPVIINGVFGTATIGFNLIKEGADWQITDMEINL